MADNQTPGNGSALTGSLSQYVSQQFYAYYEDRIDRVTLEGLVRYGLDDEIANALLSALGASHLTAQLAASRFQYIINTNVPPNERIQFARNIPLFPQHDHLRHHEIVSQAAADQQRRVSDDLTARAIIIEIIRLAVCLDEELAFDVLGALTTRLEPANTTVSSQGATAVSTSVPTQSITKERKRSLADKGGSLPENTGTSLDTVDPVLKGAVGISSTTDTTQPSASKLTVTNQAKPSKIVKLVYKKSNMVSQNISLPTAFSVIPSVSSAVPNQTAHPPGNNQSSTIAPPPPPTSTTFGALLPNTHRFYCALCGSSFRKIADMSFHWKKDHILASNTRAHLMDDLQKKGTMGPWTNDEAKSRRATREDRVKSGTCHLPAPGKVKRIFHEIYKRSPDVGAEAFAKKYEGGLIDKNGEEGKK